MPSFPTLLTARLNAALDRVGIELPPGCPSVVTPATDPRFGDYQSNVAMALGKRLKENPRLLAGRIADALRTDDLCEKPTIAGPGFLNFQLRQDVVAARAAALCGDPQLGVEPAANPLRIVIDFSAPNIAKPMHVGHLRSTIIGDSLARVARFVGHHVITDNHIGDWGTQFGMILYGWKNQLDPEALGRDPISELVRLYREVNAAAKADAAVRDACKAELVKLQAGDDENRAIWQQCVELSLHGLRSIYASLGIHFDHYLGESAYNDRLSPLVEGLLEAGTATVSDGAVCVFFPTHPGLKDKPALVRKADGGFLYSTTDLATIDHRTETWDADEIWYVVGVPQALHFQQIFEIARLRGTGARLVHVAHGSILGRDRKLMRTREGQSVGLVEVLTEAVERARRVVDEKQPDLPDDEKNTIARTIGFGAIKYAELSQNRMTDYVFDWDRMLALHGNTAPYLQNAYVRVRSIFRKLGEDAPTPGVPPDGLVLEAPEERALALRLCQFAETVPAVLDDFRPNLLAGYLHDLAKTFHAFFEACPVLRSEGALRDSRLVLCDLTGTTLRKGLDLLGIGVPDRM